MAKVLDVANFFIALSNDMAEAGLGDRMTNLRLQKVLFFAQGWSLAKNGKPLFDEEIEAWKLGPVVPVCYSVYKRFGNNELDGNMPPRTAFTEDEYKLLLDVWVALSDYSTSKLVNMTHAHNTPWYKAYYVDSGQGISNEEIEQYFRTIKLDSIDDLTRTIPVEKPLYRKDGAPVFAAEKRCYE